MEQILPYVQPISILTLVGICFKLAYDANGKLNNKVDKDMCHSHIDMLKGEMDNLKDALKDMRGDIKELLKR